MGNRTLRPGETAVYTTRPVRMTTKLFVSVVSSAPAFHLGWHIELCCEPWRIVPLTGQVKQTIDISIAAGALVTVKNLPHNQGTILVWTDYI